MSDAPISNKPVLLLNFEGVVCDADDRPVDGFFEWAIEANRHFSLNIFSRIEKPEKIEEMELWLQTHVIAWRHQQMERNSSIATASLEFTFPVELAHEALLVDSRSITFNGKWSDAKFRPEKLLQFQPWHSPDYVAEEGEAERPSNVVAPNVKNICPRHPWMTMQEPSGKRHCLATGCTWVG